MAFNNTRQAGMQLPTPPPSPNLAAPRRHDHSTPLEFKYMGGWTDDAHANGRVGWQSSYRYMENQKDAPGIDKTSHDGSNVSKQDGQGWIRQWVQDDFRLPPSGHDEQMKALVTAEQLERPFGSYAALYEKPGNELIRYHNTAWSATSAYNIRHGVWAVKPAVEINSGKRKSKTWG